MATNELINYIKIQRNSGVDYAQISNILIHNGWKKKLVDEAIAQVNVQSIGGAAGISQSDPIVADAATEPKSKKKLVFLSIFVTILIVIVASGVYGYFEVYLAPERVFARSVSKMQTITSLAYEGEASMKIRGDLFGSSTADLENFINLSSISYSVDFSGESDFTDRQAIKHSTKLDVKSGSSDIVKTEIRGIGENTFLLIRDLLDVSSLGFIDPEVFLNQWIRFDPGEYEELLTSVGRNVDTEISGNQLKRYKDLVFSNNPIEKLGKLDSEVIGGVPTYHYKFLINKDNAKKIIIGIYEDYTGDVVTDRQKEDLDEGFADIDFYGGEVWIGKGDEFIRKLALNVNVDNYYASDSTIILGFTITLDKFNKSFDISAPENYKTIEEIVSEISKSLGIPTDPTMIELPDELPEGFETEMFELQEDLPTATESGISHPLNILTELSKLKSVAGYATSE